jgi:hypothetical protein
LNPSARVEDALSQRSGRRWKVRERTVVLIRPSETGRKRGRRRSILERWRVGVGGSSFSSGIEQDVVEARR